jgi:hypothetical protein
VRLGVVRSASTTHHQDRSTLIEYEVALDQPPEAIVYESAEPLGSVEDEYRKMVHRKVNAWRVCGHLKLTHLGHQKLTHLAAIAEGMGRSATTA